MDGVFVVTEYSSFYQIVIFILKVDASDIFIGYAFLMLSKIIFYHTYLDFTYRTFKY